jgi:hypothetical protein
VIIVVIIVVSIEIWPIEIWPIVIWPIVVSVEIWPIAAKFVILMGLLCNKDGFLGGDSFVGISWVLVVIVFVQECCEIWPCSSKDGRGVIDGMQRKNHCRFKCDVTPPLRLLSTWV